MVVAEIARSRGKAHATHVAAGMGTLALALGLAAGAPGLAMAAGATGTNAIADGSGATASAKDSVAIGTSSSATGESAIAIGNQASSAGQHSTAIGTQTTVEKDSSVAIGYDTHAVNDSTVAIGSGSYARGRYSVVMGLSAVAGTTTDNASNPLDGGGSVAIGYAADAEAGRSIAIGTASTAQYSVFSTALGDSSNAQTEGSVALGAGSVATRAAGNKEQTITETIDYNTGKTTTTKTLGNELTAYLKPDTVASGQESTWTSTTGAVSVGGQATYKVYENGVRVTKTSVLTRQITNVAAGSEDTDAVNVAQLKAARTTVTSSDNSVGVTTTKDADDYHTNYDLKVATATLSSGTNGQVTSTNPATGTQAYVTGDNVASAINKSGFNLTTSASAGTVSGTSTELINPGATVTLDAGKNMALTQNGNTITIATKDDVTFGSGDKQVAINGTSGTVTVGTNDNQVKLDGTNGSITAGGVTINNGGAGTVNGLTNKTWNSDSYVSGQAATEDQLHTVEQNAKSYTDSQISTVNNAINNTNTRIDGIDTQINTINFSITDMNTKMDGMNTTITNVSNKVDQVAKQHTTVSVNNGSTSGNLVLQKTDATDQAGDNYDIALANDLTGLNSVQTNTLDATTVNSTNVNATTVKASTVNADTVTGSRFSVAGDGSHSAITIAQGNVDMGGNTVNGVADGKVSADSREAVNGSQLYARDQAIGKLGSSVNRLDNKINRAGAGAAALAALHPQDFDPDDKWDFAAGYGNYHGANAAAIGAFYRPTEDIMVSIGGSTGGGENMINAGVSFKLGQHNHISRNRVAMGKEIQDLRATVARQDAQIQKLTQLVNQLVGAQKGAVAPGNLDTEVESEPSRIKVAVIEKDQAGKPVIERVRTNPQYVENGKTVQA